MRQAPQAEIEDLVDGPVGLLGEHILADDTEVGGTRLDIGGNVGRVAS